MLILWSTIVLLLPAIARGKVTSSESLLASLDEQESTEINENETPEYWSVITKPTNVVIQKGKLQKFRISAPRYSEVMIRIVYACNSRESTFELTDENGDSFPVPCDFSGRHRYYKARGYQFELTAETEEPFELNVDFRKYSYACGEAIDGFEGHFILEYPASYSKPCRFVLSGGTEVDIRRIDNNNNATTDFVLLGGPSRLLDISNEGEIHPHLVVSGYVWCDSGVLTITRKDDEPRSDLAFGIWIRVYETRYHKKEAQIRRGGRPCH